ncbi:MAG: methionyl-tRNA formyltransferase [Clostridia bacterium]|nr:methionyl-tRNA formyltransferase [Clostridia bacterium]
MRIVFMGTPDFAVTSLKALCENSFDVAAVVSQPDKPKGRKQVLEPTPVKSYAISKGINVFQPHSLADAAVLDALKKIAPDVIIVVAYGKILPKSILSLPKYGCMNVHASLLPRHRGAAPIQRSIIAGDKETGVTIMQMDEGLDTGDIIFQIKTDIYSDETSGELFERLSQYGAHLLTDTLRMIEAGEAIPREKQSEDGVTYAAALSKKEAQINWKADAESIKNLCRGMNPWPMAHSFVGGKRFLIPSCSVDNAKGKPGEVLKADENGLLVACGRGSVLIPYVRFDGKKEMSVREYLLGNKIKKGTMLCS